MVSLPRFHPFEKLAYFSTCLERWITALLGQAISFILPISSLTFLATGPHGWEVALLWTLPVWLCVIADYFSPVAEKQVSPTLPDWVYCATLYALCLLQLCNILLLLDIASRLQWSSPADFATAAAHITTMRILTATNSCCSGISVAHELIHRPARHQRWMGRMLLWTVCYDHFAVAHVRGHHKHASTAQDCATARYGESFAKFWRRSAKGQFVNAWMLETQRLAQGRPLQWWHHGVIQGLLIEALLLSLILWWFGTAALAMFVYQALVAVRLLEAVNYLQHWGLSRSGRRFSGPDAWRTDSWFTLHSFVGLSRHADHHSRGSKPYHRLEETLESPRLPHGYFVMALWVRIDDARYRRMASQELEARGLGPFAEPAQSQLAA